MKSSPGRIIAGIALLIALVWSACQFSLIVPAPRSATATSIAASTVNGALPPAANPQPVRLPNPKTKSVEEILRLKDDVKLKAIERETANKKYLDELRATGRLKD